MLQASNPCLSPLPSTGCGTPAQRGPKDDGASTDEFAQSLERAKQQPDHEKKRLAAREQATERKIGSPAKAPESAETAEKPRTEEAKRDDEDDKTGGVADVGLLLAGMLAPTPLAAAVVAVAGKALADDKAEPEIELDLDTHAKGGKAAHAGRDDKLGAAPDTTSTTALQAAQPEAETLANARAEPQQAAAVARGADAPAFVAPHAEQAHAPTHTAGSAETEAAPAPSGAFEAMLAEQIDSPAFGPALGNQINVFLSEGIQEAQLQLNPAEMGPISVQIALEGQQAHVNFGADLAQTRSAIESSLPELAAALAAGGFTLAGGGVFERNGQQGQGDQPARRGGGRAEPDVESVTAQPVARTPRGMVDTYA